MSVYEGLCKPSDGLKILTVRYAAVCLLVQGCVDLLMKLTF